MSLREIVEQFPWTFEPAEHGISLWRVDEIDHELNSWHIGDPATVIRDSCLGFTTCAILKTREVKVGPATRVEVKCTREQLSSLAEAFNIHSQALNKLQQERHGYYTLTEGVEIWS